MKMMLSQLARERQKDYSNNIILAKVGGKLCEISDREVESDECEFVTTDTTIGNEVYKRSAVFLALKAIDDVDTDESVGQISVEYSMSKGLYCRAVNGKKITAEFLDKVRARMRECVEADMPIVKRVVSTKEAVKLFEYYGMNDKTRLFNYRRGSTVNIYNLDGYEDYFYGYMAPSTGILSVFELYEYDDGFVLQLPEKKDPAVVPKFAPPEKLFNVLKETSQWSEMLGMHTVGDLNEHIAKGDIGELMLVNEALQEQKIMQIVKMIEERPGTKFVMIAGPSSSGKTTFSHRLSVQLRARGYKPHPIAVDNYFVEREQTPIDENGDYDFEALEAVDTELFNIQMNQLLAGEEVEMPTFNFKVGRKEYNGNTLKLGEEDILVIEGIHCLNDKLSYTLPAESKFKIYISALTQLNVDEHNRVSSTDGRLIRRLVRDYRTRGASAKRTLSMWESVRRGEEKNIFPYQEQADVMFNSSLAYEISVLKPYVEPLLFSIHEDEPEFYEAKRLLKFLDYFLTCQTEFIPINSILREFVGGGCFKV
jgi:uridine kinase